MKFKTLVFIAVSVLWGMQAFAQKAPLTIAFYNLENLFDTINDPNIIDEEYLPESKLQWNTTRYNKKLQNLSEIIAGMGKQGPDMLGICEIENKKVVEDLTATLKPVTGDYSIVHFNSTDRRGIDVGFIYKPSTLTVLNAHPVRVSFSYDTGMRTRDILYVKGLHKSGKVTDTLFFLVNHFPSRRGGDSSNRLRVTVAQRNKVIIDSILSKNARAKIMLLGDLNDEPYNESIHNTLNATTSTDSLVPGKLYNAMGPAKARKEGTLFYKGQFNLLDNIVISQGLIKASKGLTLDGTEGFIYKTDKSQQTDEKYKGAPLRTFVGTRYFGGYSDHFPVYINLK
jgi:predicted extracellular nuclease